MIISLLAAVLVFLLFVQGGQTLIYVVGKTEEEQQLVVNALGRKWEFTFTTLVVFGGAFFAAFPLFYSTSFGGAYWVWMSILFCFVIQAIAYEFRSKPANFLGKRTYDTFLFVNGALATILLGTAVATFFTGSAFSVDFNNITNSGNTAISRWHSEAHGYEAVFDVRNLLLGLSIFFLARVLALLYFINNIDHAILNANSRKHLLYNAIPFVVLFVIFVIAVFLSIGYGYNPVSKSVVLLKYKYFRNFIEMPVVGILFLIGVLATLSGVLITLLSASRKGIWFSGVGVVLVVFTLFLNVGLNNTAFYPSNFDYNSSLTIENASSSYYTLTVMSYVSLLVPFVAAYMTWAWRKINNKQISTNELNEGGHVY